MRNLYQLFEKIKQDLYCPVCRRQYLLDEIKLRGIFTQTLVIQAICVNNHLTVFMTTYQNNIVNIPISINDILDLHQELKNFNGDFIKKWKI